MKTQQCVHYPISSTRNYKTHLTDACASRIRVILLQPQCALLRSNPAKLLQSYADVVDYLLKTFATDQTITEFDAAIFRYMRSAIMTPQRYADDFVSKQCKVGNVYDEWTLIEVYIKRAGLPICHSLRRYYPQNPNVDLTVIAFQTKSILSIRKSSGIKSKTNQNTCNQGKLYKTKH